MTTYSDQVFKLQVERIHALRRPDRVRTFSFNDTMAALECVRQLNDDAAIKGLPYLYQVRTIKVGR
jgi:hypothetical protein